MHWINGAAVRAFRDLRKMSQRHLGAEVGVDGGRISRIESGEIDPGRELAGRIADALGVPLEAITNLHDCASAARRIA